MSAMACTRTEGFTLVELMVGVALVVLLFSFAYPSYTDFVRNAQIRTTAESLVNGLQLARAEAIRRNGQVQLRLSNTAGGTALSGGADWSVRTVVPTTASAVVVQQRRELTTASGARIGTTRTAGTAAAAGAGLPASITFTGMGRLATASTARRIDVQGANGGRALAILLEAGCDIRLCDPQLSLATHPQGCA